MDTGKDSISESREQCSEYSAPQIAMLGKIEELTHGVVGTGSDAAVLGSA